MHKLALTRGLVFAAFICTASTAFGLAQTKLIIARHGTSAYDPAKSQLVKKLDNGVPDPPLSAVGKEEAARLAKLAKAEGIEVIIHSPLLRARETAAIVARELKCKPVVIAALTEFNLGDLLGKDWNQLPYRDQLAEVFRHPDNKRPGGESFNELSARVTAALHKVLAQHRGKKILLVAHGITNRAVLGYVRGLSTAEAYALSSQANDEAFVVNWMGKIPAEVTSRRYE